MLSDDVRAIVRPAKQIVGFSVRASLNQILENQLGNKLRALLEARHGEIADRVDDGVYLVQIYDRGPWTPDTAFTQIIAKEVDSADELPEGMIAHTIPGGTYLRFTHQGPMNGIGGSYDAMHAWLAKNGREGPCPFDFEYWKDPARLEEPDTEIGIHLPLLPSGRVGA